MSSKPRALSIFSTNAGYAERFHDLARIGNTVQTAASPCSAFFTPKPFPLHLSGQADGAPSDLRARPFVPWAMPSVLIVVAARSGRRNPPICGLSSPMARQGINFRPGTWHHPLVRFARGGFPRHRSQGPRPGLGNQDYGEVLFDGGDIMMRPSCRGRQGDARGRCGIPSVSRCCPAGAMTLRTPDCLAAGGSPRAGRDFPPAGRGHCPHSAQFAGGMLA